MNHPALSALAAAALSEVASRSALAALLEGHCEQALKPR